MAGSGYLTAQLSRRTFVFGFKLWVVMGIGVGALILVLFVLSIWLVSRKRPARNKIGSDEKLLRFHPSSIPSISKEIQVVDLQEQQHKQQRQQQHRRFDHGEKIVVHVDAIDVTSRKGGKFRDSSAAGYVMQTLSHVETPDRGRCSPGSFVHLAGIHQQYEEKETVRSSESAENVAAISTLSPQVGAIVPEVSHLGWGHWYTLRELEAATGYFAECNVLGEGGYGIVYKGKLPDGSPIAVKNLLNNRGQAEREFRVEVEAIGRVRHKNLVRLLGYCVEGNHRMLVYEYVDNGNLDQWLHGPASRTTTLSWESRMKIVLGTAKALTYLHEALEPKVVHRDIKSSNILIDTTYHAKISDFGLAKLLGAGKSHVTTRVMGTFGYVAPEYANTGLLNERSDVYSFGVLLMEVLTGRDPVDYSRPPSEVNLVDWLKVMVGQRRSEEVADPRLEPKPAPRALKRALLIALRCVDPDSSKRPKMGHVVHMLEADDFPFREDRRVNRGRPPDPHAQRLHKPPVDDKIVDKSMNSNNSSSNIRSSSNSRYDG